MEDQAAPTVPASARAKTLRVAIDATRENAQQALVEQRAEWDALELRFEEQMLAINDGLDQQTNSIEQQQSQLEEERNALFAQQQEFAAQREALETEVLERCEEIERLEAEQQKSAEETQAQQNELAAYLQETQDQLQQQATDIASQFAELSAAQLLLATEQQDFNDSQAALQQGLAEVAEAQAKLARGREELEEQRSATKAQRQKIAAHLREQRQSLLQEISQRREELRTGGSDDEAVFRLQQETDQLRQDLETARKDLDCERANLATNQDRLTEAEADRDRLHQQIVQLESAPPRVADDEAMLEELAELRRERDTLGQRLADIEEGSAGETDKALRTEFDDLQRRFEIALHDVRDLKLRNAELEEELTAANKAGGREPQAATHSAGLNWEEQKRKLLVALEQEFDEENEDDAKNRLTIEGTIQITDEVVEEKDQEISELKRLLEQQSSNVGDVAVGAAAIAGMLDTNELIQQEQGRLAKLQSEWEEKLRTAEIDISVERAKIARERTALEGKLQTVEAKLAELNERQGDTSSEKKEGKSSRGRWLSRLGLSDSEED